MKEVSIDNRRFNTIFFSHTPLVNYDIYKQYDVKLLNVFLFSAQPKLVGILLLNGYVILLKGSV